MSISLSCHHLGNSKIVLATLPAKLHSSKELKGFIINKTVIECFTHINSENDCVELLEFTKQLYKQTLNQEFKKPLRIVTIQFNSVEDLWNLVQEQHRNLLKFASNRTSEFQVSHFCFTLDFNKPPEKELSKDFNKKLISQLLKQFNAEGWLTYCNWFNERCEQLTRTFRSEDSEEYQLQALLEDFSHEVKSSLLYDLQQNLIKNILEQEIALASDDRDRILSLEKLIVAARIQLFSDLEIQSALLTRIADGIQKIEEMHPEFSSLKRQAILLDKIVQNHFFVEGQVWSWEKQVLMMQLLDEQMQVLPMICYDVGAEPAASVLSMRLAIAEMKNNYSFDVLLETCLEWDREIVKDYKIRYELRQLSRRNLEILLEVDRG